MFIVIKLRRILLILILIIAVFAGVVTYSTNNTNGNDECRVPIIMYHCLLKDASRSGDFIITPEMLESDLKYLADKGYHTVVAEDLIRYVYEGVPLPQNPIMLTFDDGHFNCYSYAYPLLKKYNMRGMLSVVGAYSDKATAENSEDPNYSYLSWGRIKELAESGVFEMQNHSDNLHTDSGKVRGSMRKIGEPFDEYKKRFCGDLQKAQDKICDNTGRLPTAFTYPFGLMSDNTTDILRSMGFQASFSCVEGINIIKYGDEMCLFRLKRNNRTCGADIKTLIERHE